MINLIVLMIAAAASIAGAIVLHAHPQNGRESLISLAAIAGIGGIALFVVGALLTSAGVQAGIAFIKAAYVLVLAVLLAFPGTKAIDHLFDLVLGAGKPTKA